MFTAELSEFTYTHTYIHTYIHTYTHTYIHTYIHTYTHTHIHTYIHTYTHTHIHIHIHIYIHTRTAYEVAHWFSPHREWEYEYVNEFTAIKYMIYLRNLRQKRRRAMQDRAT